MTFHTWKTVICCRLPVSTVIIVLHSCVVITCTCIFTGVYKNSRSSAVFVNKKSSPIQLDPFLVEVDYHMQYKSPAKPPSMVLYATQLSICVELSIASPQCSIRMLHINIAITFTLNIGIYNYLLQIFTLIDLSLNARTIHNSHGSQL